MVPVQIRSIGRRGMSTKDPYITDYKPYGKEAIQCHFEVVHEDNKPAKEKYFIIN